MSNKEVIDAANKGLVILKKKQLTEDEIKQIKELQIPCPNQVSGTEGNTWHGGEYGECEYSCVSGYIQSG